MPVLQVSHAEEEGKDGWPHGVCGGAQAGSMLVSWAWAARTWPTLCAGRVPPEDDEYDYSEYSVEDYHDPEAPQDGDGENGGWTKGVSGRAGRAGASLASC